MYEITVSVPQSELHLLDYIKKQTTTAISEMDAISTDVQYSGRQFFSVACSDTFRFQMRRLLVDSVSEAMALGYKNLFMRKCLHISGNDFFQNVLVNTMCVFDRAYDMQIISKVLDVDKPIYIDGYCNFRLGVLKRKWSEIAKLVSDNQFILQDSQLILEFLQYLLDSVTRKVNQLTVTFEGDSFLLYDTSGNILPTVESLAPHTTVEEEVALNVMLLKPRHVVVYYSKLPSQNFRDVMQLFDCKYNEIK